MSVLVLDSVNNMQETQSSVFPTWKTWGDAVVGGDLRKKKVYQFRNPFLLSVSPRNQHENEVGTFEEIGFEQFLMVMSHFRPPTLRTTEEEKETMRKEKLRCKSAFFLFHKQHSSMCCSCPRASPWPYTHPRQQIRAATKSAVIHGCTRGLQIPDCETVSYHTGIYGPGSQQQLHNPN